MFFQTLGVMLLRSTKHTLLVSGPVSADLKSASLCRGRTDGVVFMLVLMCEGPLLGLCRALL